MSSAPITTLLNTHHHGDHTYGNSVIGAATFVGHETCRAEVLKFGSPTNTGIWDPVEWGAVVLAPPTITFAFVKDGRLHPVKVGWPHARQADVS